MKTVQTSTKKAKARAKAKAKESPKGPKDPRRRSTFHRAALQKPQMESLCASHTTKASVDFEGLGLVVREAIISATNRDAISPSHTMSAVTPKSDNHSQAKARKIKPFILCLP